MNTVNFIKILKILNKESQKWNPPVLDLMAAHEETPFKILIATILSARTKDEVTAIAARKLFNKADSPLKLSKLPVKQIEKLIYPVGFFKNKAKHLKETANILINTYSSQVPDTIEKLLILPGVGRKTANLVLSLAFQKPAICVDIHVFRITNRLNYIKTSSPHKTEIELRKKLPEQYWSMINRILVAFGQTICRPVSPKCEQCIIKNHCANYKTLEKIFRIKNCSTIFNKI